MLSLAEAQAVENITDLLYEFRRGSGDSTTGFQLAAAQARVGDFWIADSFELTSTDLVGYTNRGNGCEVIIVAGAAAKPLSRRNRLMAAHLAARLSWHKEVACSVGARTNSGGVAWREM
jgi:hypothetical protein